MEKAARIISTILHPFVLFDLGILFFIGENFNWDLQKLFLWGALLVVINILLIAFIKWGMKTKHFSNFDVSKRKQRFLLYQVVIFLCIVFYLFGRAVGVSETILKFSLLFLVFIIVLELINIRIKASVHIASMTIVSIAAAAHYGGLLVLLPILIPFLGWSRVYVKRHTFSEVSVGFVVGLLILTLANFIIG